ASALAVPRRLPTRCVPVLTCCVQISLPRVFFDGYGDHRYLHSFPTRRSSDLKWPTLWRATVASGSAVYPWSSRILHSWSPMTAKIGRAHVELQSRENLVCRLLLEKKKRSRSRTGAYVHGISR